MSRRRLTVSILTAAGVLLIAGASVICAFPSKIVAQPATPNETSSAAAVAENSVAASVLGSSMAAAGVPDDKNMKVYKVGGKVRTPVPIYKPEPPYTKAARKKHLEGTLTFMIVVNPKGSVISVREVSKRLGDGLDESAAKTIRTWKFEPATRDGVPVAVRMRVEVSFKFY